MEQKSFFNVQSGKGDMLKKTYVFLKGDLYQWNWTDVLCMRFETQLIIFWTLELKYKTQV